MTSIATDATGSPARSPVKLNFYDRTGDLVAVVALVDGAPVSENAGATDIVRTRMQRDGVGADEAMRSLHRFDNVYTRCALDEDGA